MNKIKITLISLILIINYLFLGFIMAHNLYFNGEKQDLIYYNLEPQSTVRNNKNSSAVPDYVSSTGVHEMLKNTISYIDFSTFLEHQVSTQSVTYPASAFKSNFLGYSSNGAIKNGYFFPVTSGVINPNNKATLAEFSDTLISGFVVVYFNTNDICLYKEFTDELLPFTLTFTYNDAINNINNKTKVSLSDAEKAKLFTPTVTIEQSESTDTGYALSMTATTSQTNIIQDNHCGVQLNSVKQIKLDSWDNYPANTGVNLIETDIEGSTAKNYTRLYHIKSNKKVEGEGAYDPDFQLPLTSLDNGRAITSATASGFICLSTVYPETSNIKKRYIYFPSIDLKSMKYDTWLYGEKFYNNYGWGLKLSPYSDSIACFVISDTSGYIIFDAYIYQYGQSIPNGASPA